MFTDTHCHIYSEYYDDIDKYISNAVNNNVTRFINNACNLENSLEVIKLCNKYDNMYGAIGLHPEDCNKEFDYDLFYKKNKKIIAIGEIGLDYHYGLDDKDKQIEVLEKQLKIAEELDLPVIIHSRDAFNDTYELLKKYKVRGVIHSFSGTLEEAKKYIDLGFVLGVNGIITFKSSNIKDVIKEVGINHIILETDSPYLTPVPYRGTTNESSRIYDIALFVANLFNISLEEVSKITNNTIKEVFDI